MKVQYSVIQGILNSTPFLLGLLLLDVRNFAWLAIASIAYGWTISLLFSTVLEVPSPAEWTQSQASMCGLAALVSVVTATVMFLVMWVSGVPLELNVLSTSSIWVAINLFVARYVAVRAGSRAALRRGDLFGLAGLVAGLVIVWVGSWSAYAEIVGVWGLACVFSLAGVGWNPRAGVHAARGGWWWQRRRRIASLLGDSLLMDVGVVGVPLAIGAISSVNAFAGYRAYQTLAGPVNILMASIRPFASSARKVTVWIFLGLCAAALSIFSATWVALDVLGERLEALEPLRGSEVVIAVAIAARIIAVPCYFRVRAFVSGRQLAIPRVLDLAGNFILPTVGVVMWGLKGALIGAALAGVGSCVIWLRSALRISSVT